MTTTKSYSYSKVTPDVYTVDSDPVGTPKVFITKEAWEDIQLYVKACEWEINGFGLVQVVERGVYFIDEVFITRQRVSAGHAIVDDADYHRMLAEIAMEDPKDPTRIDRVRFQWHSHVNGPAYPSKTDTDTIERVNATWWISLVTNKHGDISCRIDINTPELRLGFYVPMVILEPAIPEDIVQEVADLVTHDPLPIRKKAKQSGDESDEDEPDGDASDTDDLIDEVERLMGDIDGEDSATAGTTLVVVSNEIDPE